MLAQFYHSHLSKQASSILSTSHVTCEVIVILLAINNLKCDLCDLKEEYEITTIIFVVDW